MTTKAVAKDISQIKNAHLEAGGFRLFDGIRLTTEYVKVKKE
jgi:hypothetical protein